MLAKTAEHKSIPKYADSARTSTSRNILSIVSDLQTAYF